MVRGLLFKETGGLTAELRGRSIEILFGTSRFPAGNPIANVFVVIAGALIIALSVVVGFFAFVVLGSVIAVLAAVVGLRIWWFNRKLKMRMPGEGAPAGGSAGRIIEGEFHVVEDDRDRRR